MLADNGFNDYLIVTTLFTVVEQVEWLVHYN